MYLLLHEFYVLVNIRFVGRLSCSLASILLGIMLLHLFIFILRSLSLSLSLFKFLSLFFYFFFSPLTIEHIILKLLLNNGIIFSPVRFLFLNIFYFTLKLSLWISIIIYNRLDLSLVGIPQFLYLIRLIFSNMVKIKDFIFIV